MGGYDVINVMNITDISHLSDEIHDGEDKALNHTREQNMSIWIL